MLSASSPGGAQREGDGKSIMRDFARITSAFWTGETGRRLRGDPATQVVAAYLVTAPTSNALGLYYLPRATIVHDTGLSLKQVQRALDRLVGESFAQYDEHTAHVWIVEMARFQIGTLKSLDKRVSWVQRELERYNKTPFFDSFMSKYRTLFHLEKGASEGLPGGFGGASTSAPSLSGGASASARVEQELRQESEQEREHSAPFGSGPAAPAAAAAGTHTPAARKHSEKQRAAIELLARSENKTVDELHAEMQQQRAYDL